MSTYYRVIFEILPKADALPVGVELLNEVERALRSWAHESLGAFPEMLEDPRDADAGREWKDDRHRIRVSGRSVDSNGYFWLRWWHPTEAGGGQSQRYLGFRLATEGDTVQADFEVKATGGESYTEGLDDDLRDIFETLMRRYRCVSMDGDLELTPLHVDQEEVPAFWERLSTQSRCLPVVVVSERRGGGLPVDADVLQSDLFGLARVAVCSDQAAWSLGWHSWRLMCYDGQIRVYAPNLSRDDDHLRHRSWGPEEVAGPAYDDFLQALRDECAQRIHYPEGRDALRVFSRVRWASWHRRLEDGTERTREAVLSELSDYVDQKNEEVERERDLRRRVEAERDYWKHLFETHRNEDAKEVTGGDTSSTGDVRNVQDVVEREWEYVRIFSQATRDCPNTSVDNVQRLYTEMLELDRVGAVRRGCVLGMSEEDWMSSQGISNFAGGETAATMRQFGPLRTFMDDDGSEIEMPCHIKIGRKWRIHIRWSDEEGRWLVGYFGKHLRTSTS